MIPYLILTDKDGNVYNFPQSFFMTSDGASTRTSAKELLFAHGGRQMADGFVNSRKLTIEGSVYADDSVAFETKYRNLVRALLKGGKLTISDDLTRFISVSNPAIDSSWEHYPTFKNVGIVLDAVFPFWQDAVEINETHVVAGNDSFTVDLSDSDAITMPIIEIDSDKGVDVPGIILRNVTDGGMVFEYNNALFLSGNVIVFNSQLGTIMLNNVEAFVYFVRGSFLRLQPIINTIEYEGAACTIIVKYRKLYL